MEQIQTMIGEEVPVEPEADVRDHEDEGVLDSEQNDTEEMGELPVEDWDYQRPKRGQVRSGVILAIEDQEIIVDVGVKRDGIVPFADMQRMGPEALAELSVGDEVPVYILRPEDRDGNLLVSLYLARQEKAWQRAQEMADSGQVWEGQVIGYNKGGVVVPVGEIRGFVPASQVPGFPRGLDQEERLERLATLVGENLMLKVIEINRRKRRLILSASAAQRQWRKQHRERLLDELREGEVRRGRVSSLCSFGAFVDLGGADGLIHLSELSWRRVRHPREAVSFGDEVEVYVLRLDAERKRIGLSLKRLQPEPWALVEDRYELGQLIEGVVTNVVDFGAFAEIEEGIEGLIHISELTDGSISHAREVVKRGDLLLLRIIRIDARRKRLGLSLKRVLESEWAEWAARLAIEDRGEPGAQGEAPQPADDQEMEEPAAPEPEEPEEAEASEPLLAEEAADAIEAEDLGDSEPEAVEPDVEEEPEVLAEAEEPVEAEVPEQLVAEEAEDVIEIEDLEGDAEPETLEPDVEEEPEALAEPGELEAQEVEGDAPVAALVEELVELVETDETGLTEIVGTGVLVSESQELEGVEDSQSPESEGAEELVEMVLEQSEDVHGTPDLPDTGVEEDENPEALTVDDPELAAEEA
jgi:small subunit ribosomal protein S1